MHSTLIFAEWEHGRTVRSVDKGEVSSIFPSGFQPDGRETKTQSLCLPSPIPLPPPSFLSSCLKCFQPIIWIVCSLTVPTFWEITSNCLGCKNEVIQSQKGALLVRDVRVQKRVNPMLGGWCVQGARQGRGERRCRGAAV